MTDRSPLSPSEKREARDAARKGDRLRRKAIEQAMRAGWAEQDADEVNWLDEAARAHPGPEAAVRVLYGLAIRLVEQLADTTGEDREQVLAGFCANARRPLRPLWVCVPQPYARHMTACPQRT